VLSTAARRASFMAVPFIDGGYCNTVTTTSLL
jgi:hypothetical protein